MAVVALIGVPVAVRQVRLHREQRDRAAFSLWEARPGMPFATYDDHTDSVSRQRFACRPFTGSDRLCELRASGLAGRMRLIVDSAGLIVLAHFAPTAESGPLRDEARRLAAEWGLVQPGMPRRLASDDEASGFRWVSPDGRWSAEMVYGRRWRTIPIGMGVADEAAIERIRRSSAEALFLLTAEGVVEPPVEAALGDAKRQAAAKAQRTAAALTAASRALAISIAARPVCTPERQDRPVAGDTYAAIGSMASADIVEAIRLAYSGSRLMLGAKAYLIDASGRGEEVLIRAIEREADNDLIAFAMSYPRRAMLAERSAASLESACRAPGDVVIARRVAGRVVESERVVLDEESSVARVAALDWLPSATGGLPQLSVRYTSHYHTPTWIGEVDWKALIAIDGLRVERRVPLTLRKRDRSGAFDMATPLVIDGIEDTGIRISAVDADSLPRFLFLPTGPAGYPSGWMLLGQFPSSVPESE